MSQIAEILKSWVCQNTPFYFDTITWDDGSFRISLVHNTDRLRYKLEYYSEKPNYIISSIEKMVRYDYSLIIRMHKIKLEV
jgi:hypothetical protein